MNANELMLEDWVYAKVQVDDTGTEPVYETIPKRVSELSRGINGIYTEDTSTFAGAEILPIPLTPEILEMNYGKETRVGISDKPCWGEMGAIWCTMLWKCENSFRLEVSTIAGGFVKKHILYVHELQHALRLCGIEKEIVL